MSYVDSGVLDFGFLPHDDILEARVDNGYYHLYHNYDKGFVVRAEVFELGEWKETVDVGCYKNIYMALNAANNHYYSSRLTPEFKQFAYPCRYREGGFKFTCPNCIKEHISNLHWEGHCNDCNVTVKLDWIPDT
ncbi:MAG: hypothetical protein GTO02_10245 [Candidatus Dadabacteria bacterium]|nr:hypothetical protein [Candidatus Dadabacteria bacterium]